MKKILLLAVALLGAVCVELYSSQQDLKFDEGEILSSRSEFGPPESVHCRFDNDGTGRCILSPYSNCMALADDYCTGVVVTPNTPD